MWLRENVFLADSTGPLSSVVPPSTIEAAIVIPFQVPLYTCDNHYRETIVKNISQNLRVPPSFHENLAMHKFPDLQYRLARDTTCTRK